VTGTLGVFGEAATRGLIDLTKAIERLRTTNFRYSPALLKATLDRFGSK
jgi:predicted nucleic acid-binding protein